MIAKNPEYGTTRGRQSSVLSILKREMGDDRTVQISLRTMGDELGCTSMCIHNAVVALQSRKLISKVSPPNGPIATVWRVGRTFKRPVGGA